MPVQGSKIFFEFDPFELLGRDKPVGSTREAKRAVADYVREEILSHVAGARSPVEGESWQAKLSKEYAKRKGKISSSGTANMELYGDMLDNMDVVVNQRGMVEVRVTGKQGDKARGHNQHSGDTKNKYLPQRRFIPDTGQTFKRSIMGGIDVILDEFGSPLQEDLKENPDQKDGSKTAALLARPKAKAAGAAAAATKGDPFTDDFSSFFDGSENGN